MKKGAAITIISILAVAAIALGALFGVTVTQKNEIAADNTRLAADIADRDGQISELNGEAEAKTGEIEALTADVAAKAGEIETLTADVAAKAEEIGTLTADAAAKAEEIGTLTGDVAAKAEQIEALSAETAAKDEEIRLLKADVTEKQTIIGEKDAKIGELEAALADRDSAAADKDQQIVELQGRVDSLTAEIEQKDEQIKNLNAQLDAKGQTAEKQPEGQPEPAPAPAPAGDRLTYTEGDVTLTMPEAIKYELQAPNESQKLFGSSQDMNTAPTVFLIMNLDLGVDLSTMGDAMMPMVITAVQNEIAKTDGISNAQFEESEILGYKAINTSFTFNINGKSAPAYGTILFVDQHAYILFYASLEKDAEQVKAEMTECIGTIRIGGAEAAPAPAPAAELIEDRGLKFGMTRDQVKELLGPWDETADFHLGYSILRYQNNPFHGYTGTFGIIFKEEYLHLWMFGIQNGQLFSELETELTEKYGASSLSAANVIEVFLALDVTITEEELNGAIASGDVDYRFWHVNDQTDCVLMVIKNSSGAQMTVLTYMQPVQ